MVILAGTILQIIASFGHRIGLWWVPMAVVAMSQSRRWRGVRSVGQKKTVLSQSIQYERQAYGSGNTERTDSNLCLSVSLSHW